MSSSKKIVVAPNLPDIEHLEYVTGEMKRLGAPIVRAIWSEDERSWFAAEGSHRLAAAQILGVVPVLVDITGKGATVQRNEEDTMMTAEELRDWLVSDRNAPRYVFDTIIVDRIGDAA